MCICFCHAFTKPLAEQTFDVCGESGAASLNLEENPDQATQLCSAAQASLMHSVESLTNGHLRAPSTLPEWNVGHVVTHLARNADAHARKLVSMMVLRSNDAGRLSPELIVRPVRSSPT